MGTILKILSTPQEHRVRTSTSRGVLLLDIVNIAEISVQRIRKGLEVIVRGNEDSYDVQFGLYVKIRKN